MTTSDDGPQGHAPAGGAGLAAAIAAEKAAFLAARDLLLGSRGDAAAARARFHWPRFTHFNWALDHFDAMACGNAACALAIAQADGSVERYSFATLSERSTQVANWLLGHGLAKGDRLMLMLGNQVEMWELMLAAIKIGVVVIPATVQLTGDDLQDRLYRGRVRLVACDPVTAARLAPVLARKAGAVLGVCVGLDGRGDAGDGGSIRPLPAKPEGWLDFRDTASASASAASLGGARRPRATDPMLLYFTSGTTARPKMVAHTQSSYPVGHLSTMFWLGIGPGDLHWNISSPGWAKHAWSSVFAPWNAGAAIFVQHFSRFDPQVALRLLAEQPITSLCAAPTVWRLLIQHPLEPVRHRLRQVCAAGEPLNPEIIARVKSAWGLSIRDGYGQTETTAVIANPPGVEPVPGTMGQPLPGYRVELLDADGRPATEGEICISLDPRPCALMTGYDGDAAKTAEAMRDGFYHTGDIAYRDDAGQLTYVGRADDVFKSSGYRISPFEIESVLIEHPQVAEAAVVPTPDALRGVTPKAFVALVGGVRPSTEVAESILRFTRERLAGYKRIKRLEFAELPKTVSGKIRRNALRAAERDRAPDAATREHEYRDTDFDLG
ncbi:MAG: AMP-binding protein [Lautropia sp.]